MTKFLLGILLITIGIPFFDNISSILAQITKHICTWIATKTYYLETSLEDNNDDEEESSNTIGFKINEKEKNDTKE